ncbi:hypothetical protein OCU04_007426 [Sclerotinia nivalis]|uniref:Uncharacterized protein n=1 Tax=Sclerotinia nivalis TaxID=352851 RepID=A0A9X0AIT0_9HELO|nr:hypothetical protein OCU04_007426 [Sclerotinia nivalis]
MFKNKQCLQAMRHTNNEFRFPQLQRLSSIPDERLTPEQTATLHEITQAGSWASQVLSEGSQLQEKLFTTQKELANAKTELADAQMQLVDSASVYDSLRHDYDIETRVLHEALKNGTNGSISSPRTPEHLNPNPDHFSGATSSELPIFLNKMRLKLRANRDWWPTEQDRLELLRF